MCECEGVCECVCVGRGRVGHGKDREGRDLEKM